MAEGSMALARVAHHHAQRAERERAARLRSENRVERGIAKIVRAGEVFAGAVVGGILQGKGLLKIGPVPADLTLGVVANGIAAMGWAGNRFSEDLGNFGDGLIAAYGADAGHAIGARWKATGSLLGHGGPAPGPGPAVHGEVSPRQVADAILRGAHP